VIYTLLGTANLNGINPQRYLHYVLERIANHPSDRIDELLRCSLYWRLTRRPYSECQRVEDLTSSMDLSNT
jgi:hypothetical protein